MGMVNVSVSVAFFVADLIDRRTRTLFVTLLVANLAWVPILLMVSLILRAYDSDFAPGRGEYITVQEKAHSGAYPPPPIARGRGGLVPINRGTWYQTYPPASPYF